MRGPSMPVRQAGDLGRRLSREIADPEAFVRRLEGGLRRLADADSRSRDSLGSASRHASETAGVRPPLLRAVARPLHGPLEEASPAIAVYLAERLARSLVAEVRRFAFVPLARSLPDDPERTWQLLRRLGGEAEDRLTIDRLAPLVARGILLEPYRWAELEQLVYAPRPWERRLAAAALIELAHLAGAGHPALGTTAARRALAIVESLLGDPEPAVAGALERALRAWREVDPGAVNEILRREARRAAETADPARARVVREALIRPGGDGLLALELEPLLTPLHGRRARTNTSPAHRAAAAFRAGSALPDARNQPERPLGGGAAGVPDGRTARRSAA